MTEWDTPVYPATALSPGAGWRPVGSAFAASAAVHALAIATIAAILVREPYAATIRAELPPLQAVLVGTPTGEPDPARARVATAAVPPPPPSRAPAPKPSAAPLPWVSVPIDTSAPAWIYSRPMVSEGIVAFENRNFAMLGERVERAVLASYPNDPEYPVVLKPAEVLGYPIDALESGIEGKVVVWFGVDEEGRVVEREALDGPPELTQWVLERLDRLVDMPARNGDVPTRGWVALEIEFSRDAAAMARDIRAAEEERLKRAELRAKAREADR